MQPSKAYTEQLPRGNDYTILKKVYFIGILNFNIFDNKKYISRHLIINQETGQQDLKDFEFTFIELPKFDKSLKQLIDVLDKWIFFIKNANDLTLIPEEYNSIKEFKEAFDIATQTAWNKKEMEVYDYMALKEFDEINALRTAKRKGLAKGIEQGIKQGIEKGIEQGEKQAKIEIAKKLLKVNMDMDVIKSSTGLSITEINQLL